MQLFDVSRDWEQNIAIGFRFALDSQFVCGVKSKKQQQQQQQHENNIAQPKTDRDTKTA